MSFINESTQLFCLALIDEIFVYGSSIRFQKNDCLYNYLMKSLKVIELGGTQILKSNYSEFFLTDFF